MIEMRAKHHVRIFEYRIAAFDYAHNIVTDLFVDYCKRVVDVNRDTSIQSDGRDRLAALRHTQDIGPFHGASFKQRLIKSLIAGKERRHKAIDPLYRP